MGHRPGSKEWLSSLENSIVWERFLKWIKDNLEDPENFDVIDWNAEVDRQRTFPEAVNDVVEKFPTLWSSKAKETEELRAGVLERLVEAREAIEAGLMSRKEVLDTLGIKAPQAKKPPPEKPAEKPVEVKPSEPVPFRLTTDQLEVLKKLFINQLILRGFSERFAARELEVVMDEIRREASVGRDFEEAKRLVTEFARTYVATPRAPPVPPRPIGEEVSPGIAVIGEVEGRSPVDNRPMETRRTFPYKGLEYRVKEPLRLWVEQAPTYDIDSRGNRVPRPQKMYLWNQTLRRHTEVTVQEMIMKQLVAPWEIERSETIAARAYKDYLNGEPDEKTRGKFSLTEERYKQIIRKGQTEGLHTLYDEVED